MVSNRLAEYSRGLFKNAYVLPAAALILRMSDGTFTRRMLGKALDVQDNVVDTALDRLRDAELIKAGQTTRGAGGGTELTRVPDPFWIFVEQICVELIGPKWRDNLDSVLR